jgi:hypothetical protein
MSTVTLLVGVIDGPSPLPRSSFLPGAATLLSWRHLRARR